MYSKFAKLVLSYIRKHGDSHEHEQAGLLMEELAEIEALMANSTVGESPSTVVPTPSASVGSPVELVLGTDGQLGGTSGTLVPPVEVVIEPPAPGPSVVVPEITTEDVAPVISEVTEEEGAHEPL